VRRAICRRAPEKMSIARMLALATPPLIGGGARHAHSLEPRHADVRLETRNSRKTAVDDDMHALDGHRRFCDRGREHYLAHVLGCWRERKVLRLHVHRAIKGGKRDRRIADAFLQPLLDPPDFALARQECQDRTGFRPQHPYHRVRHLILDARIVITAEITRLDRERAAFAGDDGSIAEKLGDPSAV
jgi:hypothetical protein